MWAISSLTKNGDKKRISRITLSIICHNFGTDTFFDLDPLKTAQGMLSVKVFRLSNKMMAMYKESEFSAER